MATGITVTMLCPGPTFSNLLAVAATEKAEEVSIYFFFFGPTYFNIHFSNFP